jgi:hypothetical protein
MSVKRLRKKQLIWLAIVGSVILVLGASIGPGWRRFIEYRANTATLEEITAARDSEINRTDITGALSVFGTTYGSAALEEGNRGLFTSLIEGHMFQPYTSLSDAVAKTQNEMVNRRQRAEVSSSLNGDIFLNPRNVTRRFFALSVGWDAYPHLSPLTGAVADARSIHQKLAILGYDATFLEDHSIDEFEKAIDDLINRATAVCAERKTTVPSPDDGTRGLRRLNELRPCQNVVLFIYFAGHGFAKDGVDYIAAPEAQLPLTAGSIDDVAAVNVNELKARLAAAAAIQVIIADISRTIVGDR